MNTKKIAGAVFALGFGGIVAVLLGKGIDTQAPEKVNPCKDARLAYADQNSCAAEAKAVIGKEARGEVYARYIAKAEATQGVTNSEYGPAPTKMWTPGQKKEPTKQTSQTAPAAPSKSM